jgi:hypothetical protein
LCTALNLEAENVSDIVNICYGHDVVKQAEKVLKGSDPEWKLGDNFYPAAIEVA